MLTGRDLRKARESLGVGLASIAEKTGKSRGHLSKVERGVEGRQVTPALIHAYEKALGVPIAKVVGRGDEAPIPWVDEHDDRLALSRRAFLKAGPMAGLAGVPSAFLWSIAQSSFASASAVPYGYSSEMLTKARNDLCTAATEYVTTSNLPSAIGKALQVQAQLAPLKSGGLAVSQTRELYVLDCATCLLLASASHDYGEYAVAMMQADAAERYAQLAQVPGLIGWVMCTKAMIDLWRGRPREVLKHAEGCPDTNGSDSHRLAGLKIRALAGLGRMDEAKQCIRSLEGRRNEFRDSSELSDLGAMFSFPGTRQKYYAAVSYSMLGECGTAEQYVRDIGYASAPPTGDSTWPISWALSRSHLALARLDPSADGGPEAAAESLDPVLGLAEGQRVNQIVHVMSAVDNRLQADRFRSSQAASALHEKIQDFLSGSMGIRER